MIVFIRARKPTLKEMEKAKEDYGDYIKVVLDMESGNFTIGGKLHADGERLLLKNGSRQENLWGGGVDLLTGEFDCNALINTRPENPSQEIINPKIREKFLSLTEKHFTNHARN